MEDSTPSAQPVPQRGHSRFLPTTTSLLWGKPHCRCQQITEKVSCFLRLTPQPHRFKSTCRYLKLSLVKNPSGQQKCGRFNKGLPDTWGHVSWGDPMQLTRCSNLLTAESLFSDHLRNQWRVVVNEGWPLKRGLSTLIQFLWPQHVKVYTNIVFLYGNKDLYFFVQ